MQRLSGPPLYAKVRSRAAAGRPKAAQRAATNVSSAIRGGSEWAGERAILGALAPGACSSPRA